MSSMRRLLVAVMSVAVVAGAVTSCTRREPATPSPSATPTPPSTSATASPPAPGSTGSPDTVAQTLPVYYVLDDAGRLRLVREFHRRSAGADTAAKTRAAVDEMLADTAEDPDYRTLWPSGARTRDVSVSGDVVTVDLSGARNNNVGAEAAGLAVEQLVWTVTAASGRPQVVIELDGMRVDELWGHVSTVRPLRRGPASEVLHPVWLISPQHGDTVGRRVDVHVAGIVFEAMMSYEVRRGSTVVKRGAVMLDDGPPSQGEARFTIDLEPGTYVLECFEISAKDGSRVHLDNHTITVR